MLGATGRRVPMLQTTQGPCRSASPPEFPGRGMGAGAIWCTAPRSCSWQEEGGEADLYRPQVVCTTGTRRSMDSGMTLL